jgi:hypothetical protein
MVLVDITVVTSSVPSFQRCLTHPLSVLLPPVPAVHPADTGHSCSSHLTAHITPSLPIPSVENGWCRRCPTSLTSSAVPPSSLPPSLSPLLSSHLSLKLFDHAMSTYEAVVGKPESGYTFATNGMMLIYIPSGSQKGRAAHSLAPPTTLPLHSVFTTQMRAIPRLLQQATRSSSSTTIMRISEYHSYR